MSLLPDLRRRSREPELLDMGASVVSEHERHLNLADLRVVNRFLSGRAQLLAAVRPHLDGGGRLLDVGCASGDLPAYLLQRLGTPRLVVGLDVKRAHLRDLPPEIRPLVADLSELPFPDGAFEVVTASLVLHHFDDERLGQVLEGLYRLARRALVVSDLHRAMVPHLFGRAAFPMLFRSRLSVHDGLVSIRRGFRPRELKRAFHAAGIPNVRVRRHFPYRLLAVATRNAGG